MRKLRFQLSSVVVFIEERGVAVIVHIWLNYDHH